MRADAVDDDKAKLHAPTSAANEIVASVFIFDSWLVAAFLKTFRARLLFQADSRPLGAIDNVVAAFKEPVGTLFRLRRPEDIHRNFGLR
jgi:hypothetical protein